MILTGKEDLRIQKSIKAIQEAFEELMAEKDYEKITVKELCTRAMINKKTFYQYYDDLDALLREAQAEYTRGYMERVKDYELPRDLAKANREFFLYSAKQGKLYEKITCSGNMNAVRKQMIDTVMKHTWRQSKTFAALDTFHQNALLNYINMVTIDIYKQWVLAEKKVPLEEVITLTELLVTSGTDGYLKNVKGK